MAWMDGNITTPTPTTGWSTPSLPPGWQQLLRYCGIQAQRRQPRGVRGSRQGRGDFLSPWLSKGRRQLQQTLLRASAMVLRKMKTSHGNVTKVAAMPTISQSRLKMCGQMEEQ